MVSDDLDDMLDDSILKTILGYEEVRQGIELLARSGAITDPKLNATITVRVLIICTPVVNCERLPHTRSVFAEGAWIPPPAARRPGCCCWPAAQQHSLRPGWILHEGIVRVESVVCETFHTLVVHTAKL